MKKTALYNTHVQLGAKIVPFAGYEMPLQYSGLTDEHLTVREKAGLFDVSHMGEFLVSGENALDLLQYVTSNDVSKLTDGKVQYSCLPNDTGGIVDDLLVYRIDAKNYILVVNASNIDKDWNWIQKHNRWNVDMKNISDTTSLLALQGPNAIKILSKLTSCNTTMEYYTFQKGTVAGIENVIISATGYTGAGGFELYVDNAHIEKLWNELMLAGTEHGLKPAGLACRDTLRLEMGYCLYGNDINDTTSPMEAGLGWITKFTKDFIGRSISEAQKTQGCSKKLVGFEMLELAIPRHDYPIVNADGERIGIVTSGTMSPSLKKGLGLGYVNTDFSKIGSEIFIEIRNKNIKANVVKIPFLTKHE